jgi:hypothetical protein
MGTMIFSIFQLFSKDLLNTTLIVQILYKLIKIYNVHNKFKCTYDHINLIFLKVYYEFFLY